MTTSQRFDVTEEKDFVLINRASSPEVFVEGISQVMIGFPFTKIVLHSVFEPRNGGDKEVRKVVQTLSMPTIAAVELAKIVTSLCKKSESQLVKMAGNEFGAKLQHLLSDESIDQSAVTHIER